MKTIWILGAGASKEANYPLVKDFLSKEYFDSWEKLLLAALGQNAAPLLESLKQSLLSLSAEGTDINDVMFKALSENRDSLYEECLFHIHKIFQLIQIYLTDNYSVTYLSVLANLLYATDSAVISLNYDTLIEERLGLEFYSLLDQNARAAVKTRYAANDSDFEIEKDFRRYFQFSNSKPCYTYGNLASELFSGYESDTLLDYNSGYIHARLSCDGSVKILKPHGSLGWYKCSICAGLIYLPFVMQQVAKFGLSFGFATTHAATFRCPKCKKNATLTSILIPPTRNQEIPFWDALKTVWEEVKIEISMAELIIVAGYSFPKEDEEFRHLIMEFDLKNKQKKQVIFIDPSISSDREATITELFPAVLFFKRPFSEFISLTLRLASGDDSKYPDSGDLEAVLLRFIKSSKRTTPTIENSLFFDKNLFDQLDDDSLNLFSKRCIVRLLGFTRDHSILKKLSSKLAYHPIADFRASFIEVLSNYPDQNSLNLLCKYFFDNNSLATLSGLDAVLNPVWLFAHATLNKIIQRNPHLDYTAIIYTLTYLYHRLDDRELQFQHITKSISFMENYNVKSLGTFLQRIKENDKDLDNEITSTALGHLAIYKLSLSYFERYKKLE